MAGEANEVNGAFLLLAGQITPEKYAAACKKAGPDPKKTVFVFPGHKDNHHNPSKLFGKKWEHAGGLGAAAYQLSEQDIPSLSLPTSGMENVNSADNIPEVAKQAVADLWKAIGYGMNIGLPVRKPSTEADAKIYFEADKRLKKGKVYNLGKNPIEELNAENDNDYEPSFWRNIEATPNIHLGNYYLQQLELIRAFMDKAGMKEEDVPEGAFREAFKQGKAAQRKTGDDLPLWFREQATKTPVIVSNKKGTYAVPNLNNKQIEAINNLYREHNIFKIKNTGPSEIVIQDKNTNEEVFTINSISVTAAKSTNSKNIYIEMFQSSILLFGKDAPLFAFAPNEDEKTKMEAAIDDLEKVHKGIKRNAKIITNPTDFAKYENPTASPSSPEIPASPEDKFENHWFIRLLNFGSLESEAPNTDSNYHKISFNPKSKIEGDGITLTIEVADQDKFTGDTVAAKSGAQDAKRKQVYDHLVDQLKILGIEDTMVSTDDNHKSMKISKAAIQKLGDIKDSASVKDARILLDVLYRLQDRQDAALKEIINTNGGKFFQIKTVENTVTISVKHNDPNIAQALRDALRICLTLKITGENKVIDSNPTEKNKAIPYGVTLSRADFIILKTELDPPSSAPAAGP